MLKKKLNVLVFPCGSEIGLELHRALSFSAHVNLVGASSVDDHGRFVYTNYIGNLPFSTDNEFIQSIRNVVLENSIDLIYPTMDSVIVSLKEYEHELCPIVSSPLITTRICLSKRRTYEILSKVLEVPQVHNRSSDVREFPVFLKPDVGYGSRGAIKVDSRDKLEQHMNNFPDILIMEYLPGAEYTVDCFTNRERKILFVGPRQRKRIMNGISVNTSTMAVVAPVFQELAEKINNVLELRGAWFFQVKESVSGKLKLMEVACRLGGSSSLYRMQGVNFALLSIFDSLEMNVEVIRNSFQVELDRSLNNVYKINLSFNYVYVDFDDTLVIDNSLNISLLSHLFTFVNQGKRVILITKHQGDIFEKLKELRILSLFDEILHIAMEEDKATYVKEHDAIFIDDSFLERKNIFERKGIPVFAPDALECFN